MAITQANDGVLAYLNALFRGASVSGLGDAQLLERYRRHADAAVAERAFAALVERHGPMVLRTCQAVTRCPAEAEDAFQATFLVLARRARSLWVRDSLAPWLHEVAVRVASDAREAAARRRRHERGYAEMAATFMSDTPPGDNHDLRGAIHEELARLPRKLQMALVLCDLEGLTHEQAAGQLGWPLGTVKTRLTAGRERLRGRLARRGLAPGAGMAVVVAGLATEAQAAALPPALAEAAVRAAAAIRVTAVSAGVAVGVESLAQGVLRSMMISRLKVVMTSLLAAGLLFGGVVAGRRLQADDPPPKPPVASPASPSRTLALTILDRQTRQPIAGASLRVQLDDTTQQAATDASGQHTVRFPDSGVKWLALRISHAGHVPALVRWDLSRGTGAVVPASYTVPLEQATTIGGIVRDPDGKPIAGATVSVTIPSRSRTEPGVQPQADVWKVPCTTDAEGRWTCDVVPADFGTPWLHVSHPDFVSSALIVDAPGDLGTLRDRTNTIRLDRGQPLIGRVLDTQGAPVAGASVGLGASRADVLYVATRTDADGRFRFGPTRPGDSVLTVEARGHAPEVRKILLTPSPAPVEIRLGSGQTVRGRVVDSAGKPVGGSRVVVDAIRGERTVDVSTIADAEGRFQLDNLPNEPIEIQIYHEGYMNLPNQRIAPAREEVFTLQRPLIVRGSVTDAATGKPIDRFTLFDASDPARGSNSWDRQSARPFSGGRFEVRSSWPYPSARAYRVEAPGYRPATSRGFKIEEGEVTHDFRLTPGAEPTRPAVAGRVVLPDGTPTTGAQVVLASKTFAPYVSNGRPASPRTCPTVETDRDGTFAFPPQTESVTVLAFHDAGFALAADEALAAIPGQTLRLTVWGRVEGTLRIGANPGADQTISLSPTLATGGAAFHFGYETRTDSEGRFHFDRVVAGPVNVSRAIATAPQSIGLGPWTSITVEPGATTRVELGGKGRAVVGRVTIGAGVTDPVDLTRLEAHFKLAPPPVSDPNFGNAKLTGEARRAWYETWSNTPEGRAYLAYEKSRRFYAFAIERDGSFRIDDVVPGTYDLTLRAHDAPTNRARTIAQAERKVTIDPFPGLRNDTPLDLGAIPLTPARQP